MPAVQTSYSAMMQPALEGACATTLNDDNSDTRICETVAGIPFGRVVSEGTNARGAVLGGTSELIGLSILDRTLVSIFGGNVYRQGDAIGVLFAGEMWVRVMAAVTHGAIATYDAITGQINPVSGGIAIPGSRYITSAGAGQVALLRLISSASREEEEGSGAPDWVPADAAIHIDFLGGDPQGRAWVQGTGEVAIDTLFGSDPNTENAWDVSAYDPSNLSEFGYMENETTTPLGIIGALRTKILSGCTMRFVTDREDSSAHYINVAFVSADGNHAVEIDLRIGNLVVTSWDGPFNQFLSGVNEGVGSKNAVAVTTTPTRLEAAINGDTTIIQGTLTSDEYPTSGAGAIVAGIMGPLATYLQSVTIYDPLPDTTGLSELSAVPA